MTENTTPRPAWVQRLDETRAGITRAIAEHDQAIADAKWANAPVAHIARELGRKDRTMIYKAAEEARLRTMQAVPQPPATPVAYVRTLARGSDTRMRVEIALRARGIATTSEWAQVWHSGMAGVPILEINLEHATAKIGGQRASDPGVFLVHAGEEPDTGERVLRRVESRRLPERRRAEGMGMEVDPDQLAVLVTELLTPHTEERKRSMAATTSYGDFTGNVADSGASKGMADYVTTSLGDFANDYDLDGLIEEYRGAINEQLDSTGISLNGDEFYGPYPRPENSTEVIADAIGAVDFWEIAARHDKTA